MAYTIQGGNVQTRYTKLIASTPTTILDGGQSGAIVIAVYAAEITGGTPTLSIAHFDGTTTTYIRNAKALVAHEEYARDVILVLKATDVLQATASAANQVDIAVTYIPSDRTAKGGAFG